MNMTESKLYIPKNLRDEIEKEKTNRSLGMGEKEKTASDELLQKEIELFKEKSTQWALKPTSTYVFFVKYGKSPYENPVSKGGLILQRDIKYDERADANKDLSDERFLSVGHVIDVGPDCKFITPGMDIIYISYLERDLPIDPDGSGDTVMWTISEQNIIGFGQYVGDNKTE